MIRLFCRREVALQVDLSGILKCPLFTRCYLPLRGDKHWYSPCAKSLRGDGHGRKRHGKQYAVQRHTGQRSSVVCRARGSGHRDIPRDQYESRGKGRGRPGGGFLSGMCTLELVACCVLTMLTFGRLIDWLIDWLSSLIELTGISLLLGAYKNCVSILFYFSLNNHNIFSCSKFENCEYDSCKEWKQAWSSEPVCLIGGSSIRLIDWFIDFLVSHELFHSGLVSTSILNDESIISNVVWICSLFKNSAGYHFGLLSRSFPRRCRFVLDHVTNWLIAWLSWFGSAIFVSLLSTQFGFWLQVFFKYYYYERGARYISSSYL